MTYSVILKFYVRWLPGPDWPCILLRRRQRPRPPWAPALPPPEIGDSFAIPPFDQRAAVPEPSYSIMFTRDERRAIRHKLNAHEKSPSCPRCESPLEVNGGMSSSGYQMLYVRCQPCYRTAFVGELPGDHWADPNR